MLRVGTRSLIRNGTVSEARSKLWMTENARKTGEYSKGVLLCEVTVLAHELWTLRHKQARLCVTVNGPPESVEDR
eukprot:6382422-Prymnesium_polylepis.2